MGEKNGRLVVNFFVFYESEREEGRGDVMVQSAPSAQLLRCGLAPSSQSQPDPHIAFIYLWEKGWKRQRDRKLERVTVQRRTAEERESFCVYSHRVAARNFRAHKRFTFVILFVIFADPVLCKRLMRGMMNSNKPISQSLTQTDSWKGSRRRESCDPESMCLWPALLFFAVLAKEEEERGERGGGQSVNQ